MMNRKIELHCHLDGVLDLDMAQTIHATDADFPIDPAVFAAAYPVETFERFNDWWSFSLALRENIDYFRPIVRIFGGLSTRSGAQSFEGLYRGENCLQPLSLQTTFFIQDSSGDGGLEPENLVASFAAQKRRKSRPGLIDRVGSSRRNLRFVSWCQRQFAQSSSP
jgi:hypothetical protein